MQFSDVTKFPDYTVQEDANRQAELRKMKFLATALLAAAFVIFVLASIFEEQATWIGFVRATAEAAMVGALADWFAVTALFRHPLGLKIPHTAIVPTRKDSLGRNLGRFVKTNFLSREVISDKLRSMDVTRRAARWISRPENSELIANHVAEGMAGAVQVMKDEDVQALIEQNLSERVRSIQFAPLVGSILSLLTSGTRQQDLFLGAVNLGARLLEENRVTIKAKISEETPWWLPKTVDNKIYQKVIDATEKTLQEVRADPNHPIRENFDAALEQFVEDLKSSPEMLAKEETIKEELLQHSVVQEFSSSLWVDIKTSLIEHAADSNSNTRKSIQAGLVRFGQAILSDEVLLAKIDRWVQDSALYLIEKYGHEVELLIASTIKKWDAGAASRKIELQVGKDLQFIRINGTIVGGLAGLVIHAVYLWL